MKLGIRQPLLISGDLFAHWQTGWTAVAGRAAGSTSLLDKGACIGSSPHTDIAKKSPLRADIYRWKTGLFQPVLGTVLSITVNTNIASLKRSQRS